MAQFVNTLPQQVALNNLLQLNSLQGETLKVQAQIMAQNQEAVRSIGDIQTKLSQNQAQQNDKHNAGWIQYMGNSGMG